MFLAPNFSQSGSFVCGPSEAGCYGWAPKAARKYLKPISHAND